MTKSAEFPLGVPTVITEGFQGVTKTSQPYKGLFRGVLLPPRDLRHPVLPYRSGRPSKLFFCLCAACVDQCIFDRDCPHEDPLERGLAGTWPTVEVNKALSLNYQILRVDEVWHFDKWMKYNINDPDSGLSPTTSIPS